MGSQESNGSSEGPACTGEPHVLGAQVEWAPWFMSRVVAVQRGFRRAQVALQAHFRSRKLSQKRAFQVTPVGLPNTCPGTSQVTHAGLIHSPGEEDTIWLAWARSAAPHPVRDRGHEYSLLPRLPPSSPLFVSLSPR